jgi:translation initiation factor 1
VIDKGVARERETRLAYSTGGEKADAEASHEKTDDPRSPGIRLRLDRRASSRVVTLVSGLPAAVAPDLARELRAACGTGGSLKDGVLELQGDHRDRVEVALRARGLASKRAGG